MLSAPQKRQLRKEYEDTHQGIFADPPPAASVENQTSVWYENFDKLIVDDPKDPSCASAGISLPASVKPYKFQSSQSVMRMTL